MMRWMLLLEAVLASKASDCRYECHLLRRRLEPHTYCSEVVRKADERSIASGLCLAGFVAGFQDECETACHNVTVEPSARCDTEACRRGYLGGVEETRRYFQKPAGPEPEKKPVVAPQKKETRTHAHEVRYRGETVVVNVNDGQDLREAAGAWCRTEDPGNPACPRILTFLLPQS